MRAYRYKQTKIYILIWKLVNTLLHKCTWNVAAPEAVTDMPVYISKGTAPSVYFVPRYSTE